MQTESVVQLDPQLGLSQSPGSLLAGVLNSSHDGIMAFRSIRDCDGTILDFEWTVVNRAAEITVSRTESDLVGRRLLVEMPGNADSGLFDRYVEVVESGRDYRVEHHYGHLPVWRTGGYDA